MAPAGSQDGLPSLSDRSQHSEASLPEHSRPSDRASESGSIMSAPDMYHPNDSGRLEDFTQVQLSLARPLPFRGTELRGTAAMQAAA